MIIIECPFCGPRDECEFVYGGPVREKRPSSTQHLTDDDWLDYLLVPANPIGDVAERWWHARGCGSWITLLRNTVTHEVTITTEMQAEGAYQPRRRDDSS